MTPAQQKRTAVVGAIVLASVFILANVRLVTLAVGSEPACAARVDAAPAKQIC